MHRPPDGNGGTTSQRMGGTMPDPISTEKLLEQERARLNDIRASLTEVTEDVERDPTGDPAAGGHVADAGSEMFERARDLSIISEIDG
ncbi:MAG TPA: hypothetical protein VFW51_07115, partial [Actinomycetota bacterium]|nr:hypothetical protein [Actinomycetota bacterium]